MARQQLTERHRMARQQTTDRQNAAFVGFWQRRRKKEVGIKNRFWPKKRFFSSKEGSTRFPLDDVTTLLCASTIGRSTKHQRDILSIASLSISSGATSFGRMLGVWIKEICYLLACECRVPLGFGIAKVMKLRRYYRLDNKPRILHDGFLQGTLTFIL